MSLQYLKQRISIKLIVFVLVCLFFVDSIYAETIVITVGGGGPDNLKFNPQNVTAHKGDTILWKFVKGNHDVVESIGPGSCTESVKVNAFKSATNPLSGEFSIKIENDRDEITYMCMVGEGSHCANGMWGIITVEPVNPNSPVSHDEDAPPNNKNNTGKIAGIVIGSMLGLIMVSVLALWSVRRYRAKKTIKRTAPIAEVIKQADQAAKDGAQVVEHV